MEEDKQVLNYRGLSHLVERLKQYFIKNPKNRAAGKYLKCIDDNGNAEWAEFPAFLTFKGTVASYQALTNIENPSVGDVWKVEENAAEYVWIENSDKSEGAAPFIWEYLGELVHLTNHAGITDTATAGQVLVSKTSGSSITYEWVTLVNSDTTYDLSATQSSTNGNVKVKLTPSTGTTDEVTIEGTGVVSVTSDAKGKVLVSTSAEANQNAFSNVKVGSDTIQADSTTDTLELVEGKNISLTADTTNDKVTIDSDIPTVRNELIYSDDNTHLHTHELMFTEGLVVDTPEDLDLCKEGADVTMSTVISTWLPYGYYSQGATGELAGKMMWGYCDSSSQSTTQAVTLVDGTTEENVPVYKCNGEPQGYIFNTCNTYYLTGYRSSKDYSEYSSNVAVGIIPGKKVYSYTDYMGVVPALKLQSDTNNWVGISVSVNNEKNTSGNAREFINDTHTISIIAWKQGTLDDQVTYTPVGTQILTSNEGLRISSFNTNISNGTDNTNSNQTSTIQLRINRKNDILTVYASDPYPTQDDDYLHRSDIHFDRPVTINLILKTLSYIYNNGNSLVKVVKDFSDASNPPVKDTTISGGSRYTYAEVQQILEIFNILEGSAKRGYEVQSNPGSIFRNVSSDELILDVTPGENKVYKFDGDDWLLLNTTPQALFENGSRIAWNRITDKLFYNNGATIYRIAASDNSSNTVGNSAVVTNTTKYNFVEVTSGSSIDFKITKPSVFSGPCEIICAIKNNTSGNLTINLPYPTTGARTDYMWNGSAYDTTNTSVHNMIGESSFTVGVGKIVEIVVTYWTGTEASFNGGVEE